MIFFKNESNPDCPNEIFFEAYEDDSLCGNCKLTLSDGKAIIKTIAFDNGKPYIGEGLVKSAFNFAALKNYYMGYCECENTNGFLDNMNFEKKDDVYYNDIPTILQGNCCKKH